MIEVKLPIMPECRGCGACCGHVGVPMGFRSAILKKNGCRDSIAGPIDLVLVTEMPAKLRAELVVFECRRDDDRNFNFDIDGPCIWLDPETKECRHYEWRPLVCREYDPGQESCLTFRRKYRRKVTHYMKLCALPE